MDIFETYLKDIDFWYKIDTYLYEKKHEFFLMLHQTGIWIAQSDLYKSELKMRQLSWYCRRSSYSSEMLFLLTRTTRLIRSYCYHLPAVVSYGDGHTLYDHDYITCFLFLFSFYFVGYRNLQNLTEKIRKYFKLRSKQ